MNLNIDTHDHSFTILSRLLLFLSLVFVSHLTAFVQTGSADIHSFPPSFAHRVADCRSKLGRDSCRVTLPVLSNDLLWCFAEGRLSWCLCAASTLSVQLVTGHLPSPFRPPAHIQPPACRRSASQKKASSRCQEMALRTWFIPRTPQSIFPSLPSATKARPVLVSSPVFRRRPPIKLPPPARCQV